MNAILPASQRRYVVAGEVASSTSTRSFSFVVNTERIALDNDILRSAGLDFTDFLNAGAR